MKLKYVLYLIPAALIVAANLYWGSVVSWFLSIAIIACLLYYAVRLGWEDRVNAMLATFSREDARLPGLQRINEKWKGVLGFSLLAVVFAAAAFAIVKTTRPGGSHPWFLNNDYYAVSHSGIAGRSLVLYAEKDHPDAGRIAVATSESGAELSFRDCLAPVMSYTKGKQRLLNAAFPQAVNGGFAIANNAGAITMGMQPAKQGFLKGLLGKDNDRTRYAIALRCTDAALLTDLNLATPYEDQITLEGPALSKGMSLFSLLLNNASFQSRRPESHQLLEALLLPLSDTYLLADNDEGDDKAVLHLQPGKGFFEKGYRLLIGGQPVEPRLSTNATLPLGTRFFVGFNNFRQLLYADRINSADYGLTDGGGTTALLFDFPPQHLLKSPGHQPAGSKNVRFLTNAFSELTDGELTEGFYFQNYDLGTPYAVRGSIEYTSEKPGVPLVAVISDAQQGNKKETAGRFSLAAAQPGVAFLFSLRDFSASGFSTGSLLLYLSVTFLLLTLLFIFFPGKKVDRIEPVILAVVLALLALRYLLFWRLATFPPLEGVSRYELENTLLGFDFSFAGVHLPVPVTLVWTALFTALLAFYRSRAHSQDSLMPGPKWQRFFATPAALYKSYGVFMGGCLLIFFLNKALLHAEILTRVVSILLPLLGYCYCCMAANRYYERRPMPLRAGGPRFITEAKAYVYYLFHNPAFVLTLIALCFFAVADRGFAILFALFILLKNIFVNFLKSRLDTSKTSFGRMLLKPNNHWVFGLAALVTYLGVLAWKPVFYHLLNNKLVVLATVLAGLLLVLWVVFPGARKWRLALGGALGLYLLLLAVPPTRRGMDAAMSGALKHVSYRAAIIHKPLGEMLQEHPYSSFATRKIIETAENQWFINTYISRAHDPGATFNLRPYSRVGVDYSTQTRDVLVARFLVGELGSFVMYLILLLCILPLVLWLTAYRLARAADTEADKAGTVASYAGLIPLILFFTLALFVWLTSTNRFVFFGQDFPFLSLTSRLSVLLPLLLLAFTLVQQPAPHLSTTINLRAGAVKYAFFIALIAFFALITARKNELSGRQFNVNMAATEEHLNKDLNAVLSGVQDSLEGRNVRYTYPQLIAALGRSSTFDSLKNEVVKDDYTRSILDNLVARPASALTLNNPLYLVYDNGRYEAVYNQNLYLQLPVVESRDVWSGKVQEEPYGGEAAPVLLSWKGSAQQVTPPYYTEDPATGVQLALLPAGWIAGHAGPAGIIAGPAQAGRQRYVYDRESKALLPATLRYAQSLGAEDAALAMAGSAQNRVRYQPAGRAFALNKWVNGKYRIIYPQRNNFWLWHFANGIRAGFSNDSMAAQSQGISLDYALTEGVSALLGQQARPLADRQRSYSFSVIAADGDGRIRLMQDVVGNRQALDPNDDAAIYALQQQQFFFSNARNERDQWGNRNLIHLHLGPGSSIKPLFSAVVASGVNAGWESLQLNPTPAAVTDYAGLPLHRPWKNGEHYGGVVDMPMYIEASNNYYQGLMMFLGSYTREDFVRGGAPGLGQVLSPATTVYPVLTWQGRRLYLPRYNQRKGAWPATDVTARQRTFFGNERSLIATGFEANGGLACAGNTAEPDGARFVPEALYRAWAANGAGSLWAVPEASSFLQKNRAYAAVQENFNIGLKAAALGGYPYQITPLKMLEMYLRMATYNKGLHLHVAGSGAAAAPWQKDASWGAGQYEAFLARQIFAGMARVITGSYGTAKKLAGLKGAHPGLHFYAKTGTINEEGSGIKSSRRLVVMAADKDLSDPANIGRARTFGWYFAVDNTGDFDWALLTQILESTMQSASFKNYFGPATVAALAPAP